jgi:phosphomannomutase
MQPRLTVSGYRGIWGDTLTEAIARRYARAFASVTKAAGGTKVLVGRDGRASGPAIMEAVIEELTAAGLDVLNLGMCPTPTVLFLVKSEGAAGAMIITASHNPIQYNGLKFVNAQALFTSEAEVAALEHAFETDAVLSAPTTTSVAVEQKGTRISAEHLFEKHLARLLQHTDVAAISTRGFRVALDPINSVGCTTTPLLFAKLGVTATVINGEPDGLFRHEPEPLPKNLSGLGETVRTHGCDVGFAQDPDADRLVLCDETGTILSEETTLALCFQAILRKTPGTVVINMSTSNQSEDAARAYRCATIRTKVGEANVVAGITEHNAVAGGEGGGGVIWPAVNLARDSYVGIVLVLELMAVTGKTLSVLAAELSQYAMTKKKVPLTGALSDIYAKARQIFPKAACNELDGLRFDFPDRSWVHIRPSNTEPCVRIIAEAPTTEALAALLLPLE